jgi:hypothetical protein
MESVVQPGKMDAPHMNYAAQGTPSHVAMPAQPYSA